MPATKTRRPASPVTVKKGKPSASGEVRQEAANREVAAQGKASREKIGELAKGMTGGAKKPTAAKGKAKAAPARKPRAAGNGSGPVTRLTHEWTSAKGKDVVVKDRVKAGDGTLLDVIGRWTRKTKSGDLIPMVTGHVVTTATASVAVEGKDKKVGDRCNAVAAVVTHVKK